MGGEKSGEREGRGREGGEGKVWGGGAGSGDNLSEVGPGWE